MMAHWGLRLEREEWLGPFRTGAIDRDREAARVTGSSVPARVDKTWAATRAVDHVAVSATGMGLTGASSTIPAQVEGARSMPHKEVREGVLDTNGDPV